MKSSFRSCKPRNGLLGELGEALDARLELIEIDVGLAECAAEIARVHALDDARALPHRERDVEIDLREIAAGALREALENLVAVWKTGRKRRRTRRPGNRVGRLRPGGEHVTEVGERVAERTDLPVENRTELPRRGLGDAVAEPVVAVDDGRSPLRRDPRLEGIVHAVHGRQLACLRLLVLPVPTLELARD